MNCEHIISPDFTHRAIFKIIETMHLCKCPFDGQKLFCRIYTLSKHRRCITVVGREIFIYLFFYLFIVIVVVCFHF